jgi:hypothetical protein
MRHGSQICWRVILKCFQTACFLRKHRAGFGLLTGVYLLLRGNCYKLPQNGITSGITTGSLQ